MKTLPDKLTKYGFEYTNILRGKRSFVFKQSYTPNTTYFEVFKRRVNREFTINGVTIPESEAFPTDNAFGVWAWSYRSYDKALKKYNELEIAKN